MSDSRDEAKRLRDKDFEELMAACDTAKNAAKNDGSIIRNMEHLNMYDDLVPKANVSDAILDGDGFGITTTTAVANPRESPSKNPSTRVYPDSSTHLPLDLNSNFSSPAPEARERSTFNSKLDTTLRALDRLDSSVESEDPLTVVEKDDNGFIFYKCRFCGLTFNYMNTLRAHERVHNISQPYVCGKCGESYEFACQLEYHTLQHGETKGYKCECGRTFFSYTEMLYHKHPEDLKEEKEAKELYGSAKLVHPSTSRVALLQDMPNPAFVEEGYEPKHPMKVYSDVRSKPYICEYCSKSYADSRQLAYHMYSHRGERQFNPRSSRYLMGRQGVGYTDRRSYALFPLTSGYVPPMY
ncbi:unnamed protein product [Cylicocyclus nassatus]|uniref:Zinc finger protein unc-98 n=1 Tax=Cylicocyclus nassatus TaxID=53992 RepID=A0AA36MFD0_CYLNA|nr:unnamed protein product [Cylicocyclus nassatus]